MVETADVKTAPNDPRFPSTNQTRHCYVKYNELYRCYSVKGKEGEECARIKKDMRAFCPDAWIESWDDARAEGTWWGKY